MAPEGRMLLDCCTYVQRTLVLLFVDKIFSIKMQANRQHVAVFSTCHVCFEDSTVFLSSSSVIRGRRAVSSPGFPESSSTAMEQLM